VKPLKSQLNTRRVWIWRPPYLYCWRAGLVQLVSASSPSHQVLGSKPSLYRISAGVRLYFGYSLPQTPLVWEPLALGLPYLYCWINLSKVAQTESNGSKHLEIPVKKYICTCITSVKQKYVFRLLSGLLSSYQIFCNAFLFLLLKNCQFHNMCMPNYMV
jgi:hypothetical protein